MQDRIKEHDRDIRLAHTQTSAVSEHANETGHIPLWNQVNFIDRAPAGVAVLCSWARHFTLIVPLSTQVYKWVPVT